MSLTPTKHRSSGYPVTPDGHDTNTFKYRNYGSRTSDIDIDGDHKDTINNNGGSGNNHVYVNLLSYVSICVTDRFVSINKSIESNNSHDTSVEANILIKRGTQIARDTNQIHDSHPVGPTKRVCVSAPALPRSQRGNAPAKPKQSSMEKEHAEKSGNPRRVSVEELADSLMKRKTENNNQQLYDRSNKDDNNHDTASSSEETNSEETHLRENNRRKCKSNKNPRRKDVYESGKRDRYREAPRSKRTILDAPTLVEDPSTTVVSTTITDIGTSPTKIHKRLPVEQDAKSDNDYNDCNETHLSPLPLSKRIRVTLRKGMRDRSTKESRKRAKIITGPPKPIPDTIEMYEKRLTELSDDDWPILNNAYASVYGIYHTEPHRYGDSVFATDWLQLLNQQAKKHGINLLGVLPHYRHKDKAGRFIVRDDVKEITPVQWDSMEIGEKSFPQVHRVYIGVKKSKDTRPCKFTFIPS